VPADLRPRVGEDAVERHLDRLNRELLDRMQREGDTFVSNAVIRGRYLLRACIVNFRTSLADAEAVPAFAAKVGHELDRRLRPEELHAALELPSLAEERPRR